VKKLAKNVEQLPSKTRTFETSGDRILGALQLFTIDEPEWSVDAAAQRLRLSIPTVYRYFRSLAQAGLITSSSRATYILGPAILELDRQIRLRDPLLSSAGDVMQRLITHSPGGAVTLLCRLYRNRVVCIHQVTGQGPQVAVSYERGRPMPLFKGATSKIVLAHLPSRTLRSLYRDHAVEIQQAGLGTDWNAFRNCLTALRQAGTSVTHGELDQGRVGIAAPIFGPDGSILGSLSFVLPKYRANQALIVRIQQWTLAAAHEISERLQTPAGGDLPLASKSLKLRA
jgi:DNA-binding IclR family transcriptional regulator